MKICEMCESTVLRDKPWRRVSETPSRRYLSKRCPPPADALRD